MTELRWPLCQFFMTPGKTEQEKFRVNDPDIVLGCKNRQGEGPSYFFVPVDGGAVRVAVCPLHADVLARQFSGKESYW